MSVPPDGLLLPLLLLLLPLLPPFRCWFAALSACAAACRFGVTSPTLAVSSAACAGARPAQLAAKVTAQRVTALVHFFKFKGGHVLPSTG